MGFKNEISEKFNIKKEVENVFDVRILGINESNGGNDLSAIIYIFRALGIETDKTNIKFNNMI